MTPQTLNQPASNSLERKPLLLLVEDHDDLRAELAFQLRYHRMDVMEAADAAGSDRQLSAQLPDIIVLDINLPDRSGYTIASELKQRHPQVGIIMLTARAELDDRVLGFEVGADVYLVKPVDFRELHACIKSLLARLSLGDKQAEWAFSESSRLLRAPDHTTLELTTLEALTFKTMLQSRGSVCPRETLHEVLGFSGLDLNDIRLNTLISRLRRRLVQFNPELRIVTWRNKGYAYVGPPVMVGN
ncbi:response regulator transcription factor [Orrella daihaiensis]|uniref:Response regulator transcription factor n=1 Tax=Orrella daihaiensis TaxID=2782176 RepID=A0ABY4AKX5_9BURK|nr:response regulator transcription factor [Orrella daihaiensis]UOD50060.1 response regulator transcription factor [Orrella daihaiensis]